MKILATLPDRKYFRRVQSDRPDRCVWVDRASQGCIRIVTADPNPFDRPQVIVFSEQIMKADNSEYPYRLDLKCFNQSEGKPPLPVPLILREEFKGVYVKNQRHPQWGFPLFITYPIAEKHWLGYSFFFQQFNQP